MLSMSQEQEAIFRNKNKIVWLKDKPILPDPEGGPKRNYKGEIIISSEKYPHEVSFKSSKLRNGKLKENDDVIFTCGLLIYKLNDFGITFVSRFTSSVYFPSGVKVTIPRYLGEIHANLCRYRDWRSLEEILESVNIQREDTAFRFKESSFNKMNNTETLKKHFYSLNSIYLQNATEMHIISSNFEEGIRKLRKYHLQATVLSPFIKEEMKSYQDVPTGLLSES